MKSVLIANRGEIAVRIVRAAADAGLRSIAIFADPDADALHVRLADEAYALGGTASAETYLNIERIIALARRSGADAVHPGYGFLSENADFAQAVEDAGLIWIGPSPGTIRELGNKVAARAIATSVDAPLVPGSDGPVPDAAAARDFAERHGLPIIIKAAAGGGGRGMRIVRELGEVEEAFESARREAEAAFGNGECFVERFLERPRHVEAQVLADAHGTVIVVGLRDCSLQRRNQKLVEEAPAPFLGAEQERAIREAARRICSAAGYLGAGTVEFLLGADGTVSFLEVNTRLQVEHPVTEETTGVDLVAEQFAVAAGRPLSLDADPTPRGHAIEFRINAEDPALGFLPSPGPVTAFDMPQGPGVRLDTGVVRGGQVPEAYDSLLAKLIVWGPDRATALSRARRALDETDIEGLATVLPFHRAVVRDPAFTEHFAVHTSWIETEFDAALTASAFLGAGTPAGRRQVRIEIDGRSHVIGLPADLTLGGTPPAPEGNEDAQPTGVVATVSGTLVSWLVEDGARVEEGDGVAVLEAMKMETTVRAPRAGTLTRAALEAGARVEKGASLAELA